MSSAVNIQKEEDPLQSDRELVSLAQRGDTEAFGQLVDRYQQKIYNLTYHMTSNREQAEDLTQEAFLRAYKALKRFRGQSSFYTWLYRIAVNLTLNHLKKRKKRLEHSLDDLDMGIERDPALLEMSAKASPRQGTYLTELQEKLNRALMGLSEKHRTVVVMHDIEGVPHDEIAATVGCSSGTIRSRLYYARQQLQAELSEYAS